MNDILKIGKWLEFDAGTCFGSSKKHFGVIVGIDHEKRVVVVAVNATSQIEKLIRFADLNNIPIADAMVDVSEDVHFSKPTGIDCHRPKELSLELMIEWIESDRVRITSYNEDIAEDKLMRIMEIMLRSPLIPENTKKIIRENNYESG